MTPKRKKKRFRSCYRRKRKKFPPNFSNCLQQGLLPPDAVTTKPGPTSLPAATTAAQTSAPPPSQPPPPRWPHPRHSNPPPPPPPLQRFPVGSQAVPPTKSKRRSRSTTNKMSHLLPLPETGRRRPTIRNTTAIFTTTTAKTAGSSSFHPR